MEGVAKLCQRRLYSWLSSRCGLPVCIVGTILLVVSVLQFGEVRELCGPSCPSSPDTALLRCCSPGAKKSMSTSSVSTLTTSLASRLRDSEWLFPPPTSCSRARQHSSLYSPTIVWLNGPYSSSLSLPSPLQHVSRVAY